MVVACFKVFSEFAGRRSSKGPNQKYPLVLIPIHLGAIAAKCIKNWWKMVKMTVEFEKKKTTLSNQVSESSLGMKSPPSLLIIYN